MFIMPHTSVADTAVSILSDTPACDFHQNVKLLRRIIARSEIEIHELQQKLIERGIAHNGKTKPELGELVRLAVEKELLDAGGGLGMNEKEHSKRRSSLAMLRQEEIYAIQWSGRGCYKVRDLQARLASRRLDTAGNKKVLVQRLCEALRSEQQAFLQVIADDIIDKKPPAVPTLKPAPPCSEVRLQPPSADHAQQKGHRPTGQNHPEVTFKRASMQPTPPQEQGASVNAATTDRQPSSPEESMYAEEIHWKAMSGRFSLVKKAPPQSAASATEPNPDSIEEESHKRQRYT